MTSVKQRYKKKLSLSAFLLLSAGILISIALWKLDSARSQISKNETEYPCRIISLTPSVTESLFAIGCADKIVGVTRFCRYPRKATTLPNLGGLINPNFEKLLSLNPDMVIYQGHHTRIIQFCKTQKIKTLRLEFNNIETIISDIRLLGDTLGKQSQSQKVISRINKTIDEITAALSGRRKKRVFFCLSRLSGSMTNLTTIGPETFISEMVNLAGGENIFSDLPQDYAEINKEALLERQPEIIIEVRPGESLSVKDIESLKKDWSDMTGLSAAREKKVHILTESYLLMPTPRLTLTLDLLARTIHPEAFADE